MAEIVSRPAPVVRFEAHATDLYPGRAPKGWARWEVVTKGDSAYRLFRSAAARRHPDHLWNPLEPVLVVGSLAIAKACPNPTHGYVLPGAVIGRPVVICVGTRRAPVYYFDPSRPMTDLRDFVTYFISRK